MQQNTNHLNQFAWPQPHQTVYVNNTIPLQGEFLLLVCHSQANFLLRYFSPCACVCDLSLSSSLNVPDLWVSFSTIYRGGTPKISNCIHSFSVPGKKRQREGEGEKEREGKERRKGERNKERQGAERQHGRQAGRDMGKKKGQRGERVEGKGHLFGITAETSLKPVSVSLLE